MSDKPKIAEPVGSQRVKWWKRKPSRGEVIATICLAVFLTVAVAAVLAVGFAMGMGERHLLNP